MQIEQLKRTHVLAIIIEYGTCKVVGLHSEGRSGERYTEEGSQVASLPALAPGAWSAKELGLSTETKRIAEDAKILQQLS